MTTINTTELSTRAMLVSLNVRGWDARRHDKSVTADVGVMHGVDAARAGRYNKCLINTKAPTFVAVGKAGTALRTHHYENTLPWAQDGARILTAAHYFRYMGESVKLRAGYDRAVSEFAAEYPQLKAQAKLELNGMYREDDYPVGNIVDRFSCGVSVMPVPTAGDFRARVGEVDSQRIKREIETSLRDSFMEASRDCYKRLHEHMQRIVVRLQSENGIFRDSLVDGLKELCDLLPALNVLDDPRLKDFVSEARKLVDGITPQELRESPVVRTSTASKAQDIARRMSAFM